MPRARPLPARFRYDPGTPAEEIAEDLAHRERLRRARHAVPPPNIDDDELWDEDEEEPRWGHLAIFLGFPIAAALGLALLLNRRPPGRPMT
jgi:hypothetical protein